MSIKWETAFPALFQTLLNFEFSSNSYRRQDLQHMHASPFRLEDFDLKAISWSIDLIGPEVTLNTGNTTKARFFSRPKAVFNKCAKVDRRGAVRTLEGAPALAVDCEVHVAAEAIGRARGGESLPPGLPKRR